MNFEFFNFRRKPFRER